MLYNQKNFEDEVNFFVNMLFKENQKNKLNKNEFKEVS